MKLLPALGCCMILLWACNARQCGEPEELPATDTLMVAEQWKGTVQALTCQEIEVRLSIAHKEGADTGTYQLMQRCKDNNNTFNDEGVWRIRRGKDSVYVLTGANGEGPRYYRVRGKRLYELDAGKKEVPTYYLEKVE